MSLKKELQTWSLALQAYEAQNLLLCLTEFEKIADTAKIHWNIGIVLATLGRHEEAIERFGEAVELDVFFAVGWWQRGVSYFMLGRYERALQDFKASLLYMRGNKYINYTQLGLAFQLYSAEILFNTGLTKIYLGDMVSGLADLREANSQKQVKEHDVIEDAIRDGGRDYTVFSVPVGVLFKPSASKLKNMESRDYMGKAVLVAVTNPLETYTTFSGITRLQRGQTPTGARLDGIHKTHLARSASVSDTPPAPPSAVRMGRSNTLVSKTIPAATSLLVNIDRTGTPDITRPIGIPSGPARAGTLRIANPSTPALSPVQERLNIPKPLQTLGQLPRIQTQNLIANTRPLKEALRVTELYDDYYRSPEEYGDDGGIMGGTIEAWTKGGVDRATLGLDFSRDLKGRVFNGDGAVTSGRSISTTAARSGRKDNRSGRFEIQSERSSLYELDKIRVKIYAEASTRGMSIYPNQSVTSFIDAIQAKFPEYQDGVRVRFKDEDGDMLSLEDESDFEAAIDVARAMAKGKGEGRLEIWVD